MAERPGSLAPYRAVLASRIASQTAYRPSLAFDLVTAVILGAVELGEVWLLFHNATVIGGLTFSGVLLVFALADGSFCIADVLFGHLDRLPRFIRLGQIDVFYLRPQPILLQLMTADIRISRLTRPLVSAAALVYALTHNDIQWGPATIGILAMALVCNPVIYSAVFVLAAGLQFFLVNGGEFTNAFVYGGRYASTQPASVWPTAVKVTLGFMLPLAFTGYLPALVILGLPGQGALQPWLAWLLPAATVWVVALAAVAWRSGLRHYRGAGG
ncbi:ABC-2 family transporter protein [Tsukamurella sp. 8F]|uniref:ABC transporter permease n=1 Tax=unclassified Tsukamurella TaxID=2633480 RepID=UPI0023B92D75|nr:MULTISPECIES: ABC-2 family transporter protein [unclassified Tsukamurella]MDF0529598.1 ABC-2 family transporter protein [Tsukamurella sp. 8J]MDF0585714.1 ABC-2 family transporter protein [Tsukamurella sp. 8F]